MILLKDFKG